MSFDDLFGNVEKDQKKDKDEVKTPKPSLPKPAQSKPVEKKKPDNNKSEKESTPRFNVKSEIEKLRKEWDKKWEKASKELSMPAKTDDSKVKELQEQLETFKKEIILLNDRINNINIQPTGRMDNEKFVEALEVIVKADTLLAGKLTWERFTNDSNNKNFRKGNLDWWALKEQLEKAIEILKK